MRNLYSILFLLLAFTTAGFAQAALYNAGSITIENNGLLYVDGDVEVTTVGDVTIDGELEITGAFRADGALNYGSSGDRLVKLNGTTAVDDQLISSTSGEVEFYNVETTAGYGVFIAGVPTVGIRAANGTDVRVSGNLNFNGGRIYMGNQELTLADDATVSGMTSSSYASFWDGTFNWKISNAAAIKDRTFAYYNEEVDKYLPAVLRTRSVPVQGDQIKYQFIPRTGVTGVIDHRGTINGGCTAPGFAVTPQFVWLNALTDDYGYFKVDALDAGLNNIDNVNGWRYDLTLFPAKADVQAALPNADYFKVIRKRSHHNNGSPITFNPAHDWSDYVDSSGVYCTGLTTIAAYDENVGVTARDFTRFSVIGLGGNNGGAALPIELLYLEANPVDNSYIKVDWATATEIDNSGFEVLRSEDGINFTQIGWVSGNGTTTASQYYSFDDMNVQPNKPYYYRLNQVDFDGDTELTYIVTAMITSSNVFTVSDFIPNPSTSNTRIEVVTSEAKNINVALYNTLGQLIQIGDHSLVPGTNQINFDLSIVADGTYHAVISVDNEVYNKKLIVTK